MVSAVGTLSNGWQSMTNLNNNMNDNIWQDIKKNRPQLKDFPIMMGYYHTSGTWEQLIVYCQSGITNVPTHWYSLNVAPPPRELTQQEKEQQEKDRQALDAARDKLGVTGCSYTANVSFADGWYNALAWERKEVLHYIKLLAYKIPHVPGKFVCWDNIEAYLTTRIGGAKQ